MVHIRHGERTIELRPGETVLDGLLRSGVYFPYHCRSGACHTCIAPATAGTPPALAPGDLTHHERAASSCLTSVAFPEAFAVLERLWRKAPPKFIWWAGCILAGDLNIILK